MGESSLCSHGIQGLKTPCRLQRKVNVNLSDFCPAIRAPGVHWGSEFTFFTEAQGVIRDV